VLRRVIALAFGLAASAVLFASVAWAAGGGAQADFRQACQATLTRLQTVVDNAATTQVRKVAMQLHVPAAGVVIGAIAFNPTGNQVAVANLGIFLLQRAEVRVGGIGVDRDDRRFVGVQVVRGDTAEHELLNGVLGAGEMTANAPGNLGEAFVDDIAQTGGCTAMTGELRGT